MPPKKVETKKPVTLRSHLADTIRIYIGLPSEWLHTNT